MRIIFLSFVLFACADPGAVSTSTDQPTNNTLTSGPLSIPMEPLFGGLCDLVVSAPQFNNGNGVSHRLAATILNVEHMIEAPGR